MKSNSAATLLNMTFFPRRPERNGCTMYLQMSISARRRGARNFFTFRQVFAGSAHLLPGAPGNRLRSVKFAKNGKLGTTAPGRRSTFPQHADEDSKDLGIRVRIDEDRLHLAIGRFQAHLPLVAM